MKGSVAVNAAPPIETRVYVAAASDDVRGQAFKVAVDLRRQMPGASVDCELAGRKLNKALQHASGINAKYAVIVGARELAEGCVILKDMTSQKQSKVSVSELASRLT